MWRQEPRSRRARLLGGAFLLRRVLRREGTAPALPLSVRTGDPLQSLLVERRWALRLAGGQELVRSAPVWTLWPASIFPLPLLVPRRSLSGPGQRARAPQME